MKKSSIRIQGHVWEKLRKEAIGTSMDESVAFLTANFYETADTTIFIAEDLVPAKASDYLKRGELHLEISPLYISRVLNVAEDRGNTVIMVHSHPFETRKPAYSVTDDLGEALTSETISRCLEGNPPVGSMLFGQEDAVGRAWTGLTKKHLPADITVVDPKKFERFRGPSSGGALPRQLHDRQLRALGNRVQDDLESLSVGIVGLGGTGSSVSEQLVRMGVRQLVLVDHDSFEPSNWSRLYGSTYKDVSKKRPKVEIVGSYLQSINNKISCKLIRKSVMTQDVLHSLSACDIIFSCVDRHAPRAVLNELSYQCFIPVVDVGIGLIREREQHGITGGSIRATIVGPGLPCLFCQELVRPEIVSAEHLSPADYLARRAEGYVGELEQHAPSVISYTTMAASFGLMLFLDYITRGTKNFVPSLLFDLDSKDTIRLRSKVKLDCVCQKRIGSGLRMPFSVAD